MFVYGRCKYVQKYMIQVMAALRKLVGIIGAGFEMLQDFVDEIFQGILPASFVAKYASQGFQSAMESRYSKPTSHSDGKGRSRNHVPIGANARPISRVGRARNAMAGFAKTAGSLASSPIGKATGVLAFASLTYEIVNTIMDAEKARKMAELWPENFTLFGYEEIVNKFDDLEAFLVDDSSCYTMYQYEQMNMTMQMFPCFNSSLRRYTEGGSLDGTTSIDATQCWADAAPSIGQNSLFACTAASTCCKTTACEDGQLIPCGTCPQPELALTNRFGCHSARRKCVCGNPQSAIDRCSANMHCDAEAQCELMSSMGSTSYGSIPCKLCPAKSQVVCLLQGKMPGGCACVLDTAVRYDTCSDLSGLDTGIDSSRLCGYLHGQSANSVQWSFDMENLMLVPCAQVSRGVCSTVYNTGGGANRQTTIRMVVAASLRGQQQQQGARRLLSVEEEVEPPTHQDEYPEDPDELLNTEALHRLLMEDGWNRTAQPCRQLAAAYQTRSNASTGTGRGVLETLELRRCGFWRFVGRRVLAKHNLSLSPLGQGHDTFLLSLDDLIGAAMSRDGAGLTLLRNPSVLGSALLYHPWMRPVRALGVLIANRLELLRWVREIDFDVHEALFGDDDITDNTEPAAAAASANSRAAALSRLAKRPRFTQLEDTTGEQTQQRQQGGARRRLLSSSLAVVDTVQDIAQFSGQIIQGVPMTRGSVPSRVAGAWSTASFVWPPVYDYSGQACPVALAMLEIGGQAVGVLGMYFQNFWAAHRPIDRSLRANLPGWTWIDSIKPLPPRNTSTANSTSTSWASWVFHKVLDLAGVRPKHLAAFFTSDRKWSLQWILETAIKCDLASAVTCSAHDKDLVMSSVIFLLGYFLLVQPVCGALGLGFLPILYILSYPWFILWYAFGMGPSCFPMIPTCLMSDIIATAGMIMPAAVVFPANLRCDPAGGGGALNQTCLRECSELGFDGWADPLAFAVCDTDPQGCAHMLTALPVKSGMDWVDISLWTPLRGALARFHPVVTRTDPDGVADLAGYRVCTWVSFVTVTPLLAVAGLGTVLASALCMALLDLVPSIIAFSGQMFLFYTSGS